MNHAGGWLPLYEIMIILTLDIQLGGHLKDGCQCLVDHLAPNLLVVVKSGHGQPHGGHGEPCNLVHVLDDPVSLLPALAPQVPQVSATLAPGIHTMILSHSQAPRRGWAHCPGKAAPSVNWVSGKIMLLKS